MRGWLFFGLVFLVVFVGLAFAGSSSYAGGGVACDLNTCTALDSCPATYVSGSDCFYGFNHQGPCAVGNVCGEVSTCYYDNVDGNRPACADVCDVGNVTLKVGGQAVCGEGGWSCSYDTVVDCMQSTFCTTVSCGGQTYQCRGSGWVIGSCDDQDGWYDTGNTRCVSATGGCVGSLYKEQEYRDFSCVQVDGSCQFSVTQTRWVDTGQSCVVDSPDCCASNEDCPPYGPNNLRMYCDTSTYTCVEIPQCGDNSECAPGFCCDADSALPAGARGSGACKDEGYQIPYQGKAYLCDLPAGWVALGPSEEISESRESGWMEIWKFVFWPLTLFR